MSLYDKKNALQFGRNYGDNQANWRAVSEPYAANTVDPDKAEELHTIMDENVQAQKKNGDDAIVSHDKGEENIQIDVHQVAASETMHLRERAESSERADHVVADIPQKAEERAVVSEDAPVAKKIPIKNDAKENVVATNKKSSQKPHKTNVSPTTKKSFFKKTTVPKRKKSLDATKHTILIVDDDFDTRTMYATIFEQAGFNVIEASDGLEGLDLATKHQPDVIFTGIIMPRMDGFTMIEAIKKNAIINKVPIVINSHLGRTQDKERAKELGIRDFIVRDYTAPREVVDRITALLITMEYKIPLDLKAEYMRPIIADLGGKEKFTCKKPVLVLRLDNASKKTFSAKIVCS